MCLLFQSIFLVPINLSFFDLRCFSVARNFKGEQAVVPPANPDVRCSPRLAGMQDPARGCRRALGVDEVLTSALASTKTGKALRLPDSPVMSLSSCQRGAKCPPGTFGPGFNGTPKATAAEDRPGDLGERG